MEVSIGLAGCTKDEFPLKEMLLLVLCVEDEDMLLLSELIPPPVPAEITGKWPLLAPGWHEPGPTLLWWSTFGADVFKPIGIAGLINRSLARRLTSCPHAWQRVSPPGLIGRLLLLPDANADTFSLNNRSSSNSRDDSDSDRWRERASRRSTSCCSFRCSRLFSSRMHFSSWAKCWDFSWFSFAAAAKLVRSWSTSERRFWMCAVSCEALSFPFSLRWLISLQSDIAKLSIRGRG